MSAAGDLHRYLQKEFPATVGNVELMEKIQSVWLEGFKDGITICEQGILDFGPHKIAKWIKARKK